MPIWNAISVDVLYLFHVGSARQQAIRQLLSRRLAVNVYETNKTKAQLLLRWPHNDAQLE